MMVTVAALPDANDPTEHVTVPPLFPQEPWDELALTNATPVGRGSVSETPVDAAGPSLVTLAE